MSQPPCEGFFFFLSSFLFLPQNNLAVNYFITICGPCIYEQQGYFLRVRHHHHKTVGSRYCGSVRAPAMCMRWSNNEDRFFIFVQKYPQQTFKQQKWKVKQKTERVNHLHCNPSDRAQRKWLFPGQLWTPRYLAFIQNGGTINKPLILHGAKGT